MNIFTDVSSNKRKAIPSFLVFPNFDSNPGECNKFLRIVSDGKRLKYRHNSWNRYLSRDVARKLINTFWIVIVNSFQILSIYFRKIIQPFILRVIKKEIWKCV